MPAAKAAATSAPDPEHLAFFERKVRPVLAEHCYSCHGAKIHQGGLRLDLRSAMLKGGDRGQDVVPGDPEKSPLIHAVRYSDKDLQMPPSGKLPAEKIAALEQWVRLGAPYPADGPAAPAGPKALTLEEGRRWWSLQPVREVPAPKVARPAWVRKKMDAFVLQKLEANRLQPAAEADRRTLVRRAYFDLVGLPPTFEETQRFVADRSPDAYARLVDELLARPQYGERWARYWLDVARYGDDNTSDEATNPPNQYAFRYRDWVVGAINQDVPYNQFILKQFAADLLPDSRPEDVAALGYIGLSPIYHKDLKLSRDVIETFALDEWDERLDAVSRGLLGLTVACARCHDHKFDPFSSKDYYAFAGVFASLRLVQRPALNVSQAEADAAQKAHERVKTLESQIAKLAKAKLTPAERQEKTDAARAEIEKIRRETPNYDMPLYHAVADAGLWVDGSDPKATKLDYRPGVARDLPVYGRGNVTNPSKETVPRHYLTVLSQGEPQPFKQGSGRLELAQNIVGPSAPLLARVFVNRVWGAHFGTPLVGTPSDFGTQGDRPSHPELLDDLAARFIKSGWSLKWLQREIMLSSTYRQSSTYSASFEKLDPLNKWLWRMNRRRLEVEPWRDAVLLVAGTLDPALGGPPKELEDATNHRRTLYSYISRYRMSPVLRLFDFPDPIQHSPARDITTTPVQQLFVLNSPFMREQAKALVARVHAESTADPAEAVKALYHLALQREPDAEEQRLALGFLRAGASEPSAEKWWIYAQALLGSNEFMFVD